MERELERLTFREKVLLCLLARKCIQRELDSYPIKKYLVPFTPYLLIKKSERLRFRNAQKDFYEERYNSLVIELAKEFIDRYLQMEEVKKILRKEKAKAEYNWYWAKDSIKNMAKTIVEKRVRALRKKRGEEWDRFLQILPQPKSKIDEIVEEDIVAEEEIKFMQKQNYLEELDTTLQLEGLINNANLTAKEREILLEFSSTEEMSPEVKNIIEKIRTANKIPIRSLNGSKKTKMIKISPLLGMSPEGCCNMLNNFTTEWLINVLLGKDYSKPDELKQIEDFHNVDFRFPNYNFNYLDKVAKNLEIEPEKLRRFLEKIEFPYIYPLSKIRRDGKRLYLIDEFKLNAISQFIKHYFKAENNIKMWRRVLNNGFTRFRAVQFMKRKIDKGIVPSCYFEIISPCPERLSYLKSRKKEPIDQPKWIWKEGDEKPLTRKEIIELLRGLWKKLLKEYLNRKAKIM